MQIQVKSDLHWENSYAQTRAVVSPELDDNYVHPDAEVLVLAGDIINATEAQINYLLYRFKDVKIPILYVPGNHEYWGTSLEAGKDLLRKKLSGTNILLLDQEWYHLKGKTEDDHVVFAGATLWTDLYNPEKAKLASQSRDFYAIKYLTVDKWNEEHTEGLGLINSVLDSPAFIGAKKVVVSHHLPSMKSVPLRFRGSEGNCIFVAEAGEEIISTYQPDLYIHGHTHDSNDYMIGKTRVISNPKGRMTYTGTYENPNYKNDLLIEI